MNKHDMVMKMLDSGILLSPEELSEMDGKQCETIIKNGSGRPCMEMAGEVSAETFLQQKRDEYNSLISAVARKCGAVSISNLGRKQSRISVAGRVREAGEKGLVLEDVTGEIQIFHHTRSRFSPGDVLGIMGDFSGDRLFARKIFLPDIPLSVSIPRPGTLISLSAREGKPCISEGGNKKVVNANPGRAEIGKTGEKGTLFAYGPNRSVTEDRAVHLLRKRVIPSAHQWNPLVIDPVPSALWIYGNGRNWKKNYKGVVVISTRKKFSAEYSPDTGEVKFVPEENKFKHADKR